MIFMALVTSSPYFEFKQKHQDGALRRFVPSEEITHLEEE